MNILHHLILHSNINLELELKFKMSELNLCEKDVIV